MFLKLTNLTLRGYGLQSPLKLHYGLQVLKKGYVRFSKCSSSVQSFPLDAHFTSIVNIVPSVENFLQDICSLAD